MIFLFDIPESAAYGFLLAMVVIGILGSLPTIGVFFVLKNAIKKKSYKIGLVINFCLWAFHCFVLTSNPFLGLPITALLTTHIILFLKKKEAPESLSENTPPHEQ